MPKEIINPDVFAVQEENSRLRLKIEELKNDVRRCREAGKKLETQVEIQLRHISQLLDVIKFALTKGLDEKP